MALQSRSLEFISGNFQTFFLIPWLSYKNSKQTELKIHSKQHERVSLPSFTKNKKNKKKMTGQKNQTLKSFFYPVCFISEEKKILKR